MSHSARLAALGLTLPAPMAPVASYVPATLHAGILHVSGQAPLDDQRQLIRGCLGADLDIASGAAAARACGLMLLAQVAEALGTLDRVERILRLGIYVASAPGFHGQPQVANGVSELMLAVFGAAGRHARSAIGAAALPLGIAVEVDAVVAVRARG